MAVIGEFTTPRSEFLLAQTLAAMPDVTVEVERMVSDGDSRITPYFWISRDADDGEASGIDAALDADRTVTNLELVERVADAADSDPTALPSLFDAVDPEALDQLVASGSASLRAKFEYAGCLVEVFGDEHVRVQTRNG